MVEPFSLVPDPEGSTLAPSLDSASDLSTALPPMPTVGLPAVASPLFAAGLPDANGAPFTPTPLPLPRHALADPRMKLLALASLAASVAGGPRSGLSGLAPGVLHGAQLQDAMNLERYQLAERADEQRQRAEYERRRAQQSVQQQTARTRMNALDTIRQRVVDQGFDTKDEYDRYVDSVGNLLVLNGQRDLSPNALRVQFPYATPDARKLAAKEWKAWVSNPANARLLEQNPAMALRAVRDVDLNGDGIPERRTIADIADLAGFGFAKDAKDQPLVISKPATGTTAFQTALNNALEKFRATNGREPTPDENEQLIRGSLELANGPGASEFDRYLGQLAKERGRPLTSREMASARRNFYNDQTARTQAQSEARGALRAAILQGDMMPRTVTQALSNAGLNPSDEIARERKALIDFGRQQLTEAGRLSAAGETYAPEKLIAIARQALTQPAAPPTPSAVAKTITRAELRAVAGKLKITEAEAESQAKARGLTIQP